MGLRWLVETASHESIAYASGRTLTPTPTTDSVPVPDPDPESP